MDDRDKICRVNLSFTIVKATQINKTKDLDVSLVLQLIQVSIY